MVALFVVLTIIVFASVDYFIQRKKKIGLAAEQAPSRISLSRLIGMLPPGIFMQPTFTWSKILDSGNLILGINPVLMGIIGEPDEIEMLPDGEKVEKGQPLLKIRKGNKILQIKSPVSGTVTGINHQVLEDATWENISQSWLYSLQPQEVAAEIPSWLIAEKARNWLNSKYQEMKHFFMNSLPQEQMGITMADGGDLPVGILSEFDENTWKKFEKEFIQLS